MKISDLIISPKSLGDKLWLVDVATGIHLVSPKT